MCEKRVPDHLLACRYHWHQLPKDLQAAIYDAYEVGQSAATLSPAYEEAYAAAVAFWDSR